LTPSHNGGVFLWPGGFAKTNDLGFGRDRMTARGSSYARTWNGGRAHSEFGGGASLNFENSAHIEEIGSK
jgi:hypothetical protein